MQAAIPDAAMPFWGDERREQWVYMVKYAASVEDLQVTLLPRPGVEDAPGARTKP